MDKKILIKDSNTDRKGNKPKPFWTIELDNLFKAVVGKERALRKCKRRASKMDLRLDYQKAQNNFDRFYRKEKRKFDRCEMLKIEDNCSLEPTKFWSDIKKLGPKNKKIIPMQVYNENGDIFYKDFVLEKWKNDFKTLLNVTTVELENTKLEDGIARRMMDDSIYLSEMVMKDPLYETNEIRNAKLTDKEIVRAIKNAKLNKSSGSDQILNEVLKNDCMIVILNDFF